MSPVNRTGTYVAFHGGDTRDPSASSIRYYNTLKMWKSRGDIDFSFVDSHEKTSPVRDASHPLTLRQRLSLRLRLSKHMLLIIDETTRNDTDNVLYEINYALNVCQIPIVACYPGYRLIQAPNDLRHLWPEPLRAGIDAGTARVIHVPFALAPIADALSQFHLRNPPQTPLSYYSTAAYQSWGIF